MLYPWGICLFPLLSPIPSFHKASLFLSLFTGSLFKIASRRQCVCVCVCVEGGGGGVGGVGEEEERFLVLLASLVDFFAPLPYQTTWSQASTKRQRPAISLDCT